MFKFYCRKFSNFSRSTLEMNCAKSAAIIVIGDEILKGQTVDTNSNFICKRLYRLGIRVDRISVIPDCVKTIADEVRKFSESFDFVFTCGGIGCTHDDKTFQGVAVAFNEEIRLHEELASLVRLFFKLKDDDNSSAALKLAMVPSTAELLWGKDRKTSRCSLFPIMKVQNVHIFPGIPRLCEKAFDQLEDNLFADKSAHFNSHVLHLNIDEVPIANAVSLIASKYEGIVNIGSYPKSNHSYFKTMLTIVSTDENAALLALSDLKEAADIKPHCILYDANPFNDSLNKFNRFYSHLKSADVESATKIRISLEIIDKLLNDYPLESICLFFNGGKDCTALLHLIHVKVIEKFGENVQLTTIYVRPKLPHSEETNFICDCQKRYNFELIELTGPLKSALFALQRSRPELTTVLLGSRSTDPHVQDEAFLCTDADWPPMLRVCPIVHWNYTFVWTFLRSLSLPYCLLYDKGYTSMGDGDCTGPNKALCFVDNLGRIRYKPAYLLCDERLERSGRMDKSNM